MDASKTFPTPNDAGEADQRGSGAAAVHPSEHIGQPSHQARESGGAHGEQPKVRLVVFVTRW